MNRIVGWIGLDVRPQSERATPSGTSRLRLTREVLRDVAHRSVGAGLKPALHNPLVAVVETQMRFHGSAATSSVTQKGRSTPQRMAPLPIRTLGYARRNAARPEASWREGLAVSLISKG